MLWAACFVLIHSFGNDWLLCCLCSWPFTYAQRMALQLFVKLKVWQIEAKGSCRDTKKDLAQTCDVDVGWIWREFFTQSCFIYRMTDVFALTNSPTSVFLSYIQRDIVRGSRLLEKTLFCCKRKGGSIGVGNMFYCRRFPLPSCKPQISSDWIHKHNLLFVRVYFEWSLVWEETFPDESSGAIQPAVQVVVEGNKATVWMNSQSRGRKKVSIHPKWMSI